MTRDETFARWPTTNATDEELVEAMSGNAHPLVHLNSRSGVGDKWVSLTVR